ncbi:alpha/beta hydrolase [bacterium]|nr:MAG: alpha/beta hydrolase [bacterium]
MTFTVEKNIWYGIGKNPTPYQLERCRLDLYRPDGEVKAWLLWLHGGGLTGGEKESCAHLAAWLAEAGFGVALANYRLSPVVKYPAYLQDALEAFEWLHRYLEWRSEYNDHIFVGGHSAGAYLAAMMALMPSHWQKHVGGALPLSGQMITHFTVRAERGISENQVVVDGGAPLFYTGEEAPPFCVMVSTDDLPGRLEENAYFAAMMKVAGHSQTEFHTFSNRDHGSICDLFGTPGDAVCGVMLEFLKRHRVIEP